MTKRTDELPGPLLRWLRAIGFFRGFLLVSFLPLSAGAAAAVGSDTSFHPGPMALALFAVWCFHAGCNLLNDYYDHLSGADDENPVRTPFSGGTRVIQDRLLPAKSVRNAAWLFYFLGALAFFPLGLWRGPTVFVLAALGAASGIGYTMPPFRLCYRGFGEILIGLNFGPLLAALGAYVQIGRVPASAWLVGASLGLWSAAIITINQVPDYEADRKAGKRNLVVRLGVAKGMDIWRALLFAGVILPPAAVLSATLPRVFFLTGLMILPLILLTRNRVEKTRSLGKIVSSCRLTIIGQFILWALLMPAIIL